MNLTDLDIYALARALAGLSWEGLAISPWLAPTLAMIKPGDGPKILQMYGQDAVNRVFAVNPNGTAPQPERPAGPPPDEPVEIPDLPAECKLSDADLKAAEQVAPFLADYMAWATKRAPMSPPLFLLAGGVWAIGLAIAKRAALHMYKPIYPHLYLLWVADTSIFRKTTAMEAVYHLVAAAVPELLLPQEMTPESFVSELAGKRPSNFEELPPKKRKLAELGYRFAAQRGLIIDEASSLFGATRKDYMQGQNELILRGYDGPDEYSRRTVSEGLITINNMALSILGATTPTGMSRSVGYDSWETGMMARFILLYPESRLPYRLTELKGKEYRPPEDLVNRLARLYNALPLPPGEELDGAPAPREIATTMIDRKARQQYDAYNKALSYDLVNGVLDKRLWGNYARLPEIGLKVSVALAAIDWSDQGGKGAINITAGHWARAQQVCEEWRASLHRLLHEIDRGADIRNEDKILSSLIRHIEGTTLRDLTRRTGLTYKQCEQAIESLVSAGLVISETPTGSRGRPKTVFKAV